MSFNTRNLGAGAASSHPATGEVVMRTLVNRIGLMFAAMMAGWSYKKWDPPYPGDGI